MAPSDAPRLRIQQGSFAAVATIREPPQQTAAASTKFSSRRPDFLRYHLGHCTVIRLFFSRATQTGPLCNSLEKKKKETNTTTDDAIHSRLLSSFQASSASRRLRATTHRVNCSSTPPSLPHRAHRRPDSPSGLTATSTDHVRRRRGAADQRRPALIRRDGLAIPPKHPAGPIRLAITTIHHPIPADRRRRDTRSEPARAI